MGNVSIQDQANAAAKHANTIILRLQRGITGTDPRAETRSRAVLANLRKLGNSNYAPLMTVGEQIFPDWPTEILGQPEETSYAYKAIVASLRMYALHQQSRAQPMAAVINSDDKDERRRQKQYASFGAACRRINVDLDSSDAIRNRLNQVFAANDFDGIVRRLDSLIHLLRSSAQKNPAASQIDYYQMTEDLFYLQFESKRKPVFFRWGRDYEWIPQAEKQNTNTTK